MASVEHRATTGPLFRWKFSTLGHRIVGFMLLASTIFAIVASCVQLLVLYQRETGETLATFATIETSFLTSIEDAVWRFDEGQIDLLLDGILAKRAVHLIRLTTPDQQVWQRGADDDPTLLTKTYQLSHRIDDTRVTRFGTLEVGITFTHVWAQLHRQFVTLLLTNMAKTIAVGMLMLVIFDRLAATRLRRLADQVLRTSWRDVASKVTLERGNEIFPDEIDKIVEALELVRADASSAYARLEHEKARADTLNASLRAANKEQAELTAALSHDLITPINTLQMLLTELLDTGSATAGAQNPYHAELSVDFRDTLQRMRAQIQSILQYSTLLSTSPECETVHLDNVFDAQLELVAAELDARCAIVSREPLGDVLAEPYEMKVLVLELLKNAYLYDAPDRALRIEIRALDSADPNEVGFRICDNGRGMARENLEAAFGLFTRLHTYMDVRGTGMGLALCRRIMERYGGKIDLQSTTGKGTCVCVTFQKGPAI